VREGETRGNLKLKVKSLKWNPEQTAFFLLLASDLRLPVVERSRNHPGVLTSDLKNPQPNEVSLPACFRQTSSPKVIHNLQAGRLVCNPKLKIYRKINK